MGLVRMCDGCGRLEEKFGAERWAYIAVNPGGFYRSGEVLVCSKSCAWEWVDANWDKILAGKHV